MLFCSAVCCIMREGAVTSCDESVPLKTPLAAQGGALFATSTAEVRGSVFDTVSARLSGGAILASGSVVATNTTFANVSAGQEGGALWAGADARVTQCAFRAGSAGLGGGCIYGATGAAVRLSSFVACAALGGAGGAVLSMAAGSVSDSHFSRASATAEARTGTALPAHLVRVSVLQALRSRMMIEQGEEKPLTGCC